MDKEELRRRSDLCDRWSLRMWFAGIPVFLASLVPLAFGADWAFLGMVIISLGLMLLAVMLVGCSLMYSEMYWDLREKEWNRIFGRR